MEHDKRLEIWLVTRGQCSRRPPQRPDQTRPQLNVRLEFEQRPGQERELEQRQTGQEHRCQPTQRREIQSDSYSRDENQHHEYTSALPGESQEVTYSVIELKHVEKKRWDHKAEESRVYSDVKTETTGHDSLTYAQINHHNKGKAKKKKGL
ncbi:hypothetical protein Q5P01_000852 [Channa striata]|uniref:Uncharacterized protein n=1 Tax=Channa striata TaxID=64152 RepID=A0AA88LMW9_CHASR|nr:hypothetical protein Q5P01_000852 [Channa striata]